MARVAILWTQWSGYLEACYRELIADKSVHCFVCHQNAQASSPFDTRRFVEKDRLLTFEKDPDIHALERDLKDFQPELVLICGWHIPAYRRVAKSWRTRAIRVLGMDNQWLGSPKQLVGILAFHTFWRGLYDYAFVPGPRQYCFARLLGFPSERIRIGLYAADIDAFSRFGSLERQSTFLFVGRDTPLKGLDQLIRAYGSYQRLVPQPWNLVLVGAHNKREPMPGIQSTGFVQPEALPKLFAQAKALILPSAFEPHGVVVQEAAACGLIIICSRETGAGDLFVREGCNGFIIPSGSTEALASALRQVHLWDDAKQLYASQLSRELSGQYTPRTWAASTLSLLPPQGAP